MGRCSKYSNYLPLPYLLIGIVNFPNRNFDNFDLRPPGPSVDRKKAGSLSILPSRLSFLLLVSFVQFI